MLPSSFVVNRDSVEPFDAATLETLPQQQRQLEVALDHPKWWARKVATLSKITRLSEDQVREYCESSAHIARAPLEAGEYYSHVVRLQRRFPGKYEDTGKPRSVGGKLVAGHDLTAVVPANTIDGPVKSLTVFLGSSSAAKSQAKLVLKALESPAVKFIPWWDAFTAGRTLLEELDAVADKVDAALLVFSPEHDTIIRKNPVSVPNLNVLFEFGYFSGCLGRYKVAMLRYGDFYLPSDLGGNIYITGSKTFRRGSGARVGKRTKSDFDRWILGLSNA